jgi:chorismate mutase/prephenate dehydratase
MLSDHELEQLRQQIDKNDLELIHLLANRMKLCQQIGQHKISTQSTIRDLDREKALIENKLKLAKAVGLDLHFTHRLFDLIIEHSVKQQYQMKITNGLFPDTIRIAFLGERGSYSHQAILQHFSNRQSDLRLLGYSTFAGIVNAVRSGEMDCGILPLENTTTGSILEVYDLLQQTSIYITGEEILTIDHCLVGTTTHGKSINKVFGHPQAIAQCSELLRRHPEWLVEYCSSTATAIEAVIKNDVPGCVAIANRFAADLYQLEVVMDSCSNHKNNSTRFVIISKQLTKLPSDIPSKTSILFATHQEPGALVDVLAQFKKHNIVLTKLQSRPIPNRPWEEIFYLDFEGHLDDDRVQQALTSAKSHCQSLKILGCYPNCQLEKPLLSISTETDRQHSSTA